MSPKDKAETGVFVTIACITAYLGFMPWLMDHKGLRIVSATAIAIALAVLSLVFFLIQKFEGIKEDRERAVAEARRDRMMEQILKNQMDEMARHGKTSHRRYQDLNAAYDLYAQIGQASSARLRGFFSQALERLAFEALKRTWELIMLRGLPPSVPPKAEEVSIRNLDDARRLADYLAVAAINESVED